MKVIVRLLTLLGWTWFGIFFSLALFHQSPTAEGPFLVLLTALAGPAAVYALKWALKDSPTSR